jgi:hypothetical protein
VEGKKKVSIHPNNVCKIKNMTPMQFLNHLEKEGDSTHKAILVYLNKLATFQRGPARHIPSKGVSGYLFFLHEFIYCMNSYFSYIILSEFLLCVNSYIQPNFSTAEAVDIELAAAAVDNSLTTYAAHFASGVSILDDAEGNIKAVLGEDISDVVEASAPADAPAVMAVSPAMLAAAVSSGVAVAVPDVVLGEKGGVTGLLLSFA